MQLWKKIMWFHKHAIEEIVNQGLYTLDDPHQWALFVEVYVLILQEVVNKYIGVWNNHLVLHINDNGRYQPLHVLAFYFQEFKRLHGELCNEP